MHAVSLKEGRDDGAFRPYHIIMLILLTTLMLMATSEGDDLILTGHACMGQIYYVLLPVRELAG
jgi:hypothetical protein